MSQHGTLKRYSLIIKKVTEDYYPSLLQIIEYLGFKGFEVLKRTIQRVQFTSENVAGVTGLHL